MERAFENKNERLTLAGAVPARAGAGITPLYNLGIACSDAPASAFPARPAVIEERDGETKVLTFGELAKRSGALAARLAALGVEPQDRVGVYAPAGVATAVAHIGVLKAGAVTVPLVPLLGDEAIVYRLNHAQIELVLVDGGEEARLRDALAHAPGVQTILVLDEELGRTAGAAPGSDFRPPTTRATDPAMIIYTSGTTGKPKGAVQAQGIVLGRQTPMSMIHGPFAPGDVFWAPVDWLWIGSFVDSMLAPLSQGCPVFTYARRRFDPLEAARRLVEFRVTKAFIPPTALRMLMEVPEDEWRGHSLTSIHSGGETLTPDAARWGREVLGLTLDEIYGMTEASFLVGNAHRYYPVVERSMGRPYPGQRLALRDVAGAEPRPGEPGELMVAGSSPSLFLGYYGDPEATAERFVDGWFATGDLAFADERGYLHYLGRKDDLIISAGHRIGPAEIEEVLRRHPQVAEAVVVGVPDPRRGQRIRAVVRLRNGNRPTGELTRELQDLVRSGVGRHAYPRDVEYVDEFPRTVTGKVQRSLLRAAP